MEINEITQLNTNTWMDHYLRETSEVHAFYEYAPLNEDDFLKRARFADSTERKCANREKLAEVILRFHQPELLHPEIRLNIDRLREPSSLVIIGGHQACLFTGPLYTLYKAVTIIQLAKREEKRLGRPVLPVFWIAGEDHDWDEVNHVWMQDAWRRPTKLRYEPAYNRRSISEMMCHPSQMHCWLDELSQLLPDSIYKKEWVTTCKEMTQTPLTWVRFFARIMTFLFGKYGLLLVDSGDLNLRALEKPFWEVLVTQNLEIQERIENNLLRVTQFNYPPPIQSKTHFSHLFLCLDQGRYPLYFDGTIWSCPSINKEWTASQMLLLAQTSPWKLSNNVMTRPLMQEYLFPTLTFVGGPAEITYWGLLKDVFSMCNLQMPIVYPRAQITLVPEAVKKRMDEFGISLHEVYGEIESKKNKWLERQLRCNVDSLFIQAKEQIEATHQKLLCQLEEKLKVDLMESGQINRNRLNEHLSYLRRHIGHLLKKKHSVKLHHWDEVINSIYPTKKPQERIYNVINYWNLYGLDWVDGLVHAPLLSEGRKAFGVHM